MAWIYTGTDLSYLCCCNQRHLLAVIFIFTIVMGAPHSDFTSSQRQTVQDTDSDDHHPPRAHHHHAHHHPHQHRQQQQHHHQQPAASDAPSVSPFPAAMYFATQNNTKVTAQRGGTALLPCTVISQSSALVSWIRRQDFQLLTVGLATYSSDERFLVEHLRHLGHWALRIKSVRTEDEGLYECQLSVHPVQSVFVELKVVEAVAEIVGAPDLHIDEGSTLRLECKLQSATENPTFVFWYHEQNMVNFDQLNGFSVTPFQPPATANHPSHLHPYLFPHPLEDDQHELPELSSEEQGYNLLDDDRLLQRSLQLGQDSAEPFLTPSSSSSLLLASLAAAALSSSPYQLQQHLDRTDLSLERGDAAPSSDPSLDRPQNHPHLHHQHHQHHHHHHQQHHLAMNYSGPAMLYSHILTPAPSVLTIKEVHLRHAGNYTCAPSNARPASITVHVLQGEKPAAMQHANRSQLDDGSKPSSRSGSHPQRPTAAHGLMVPALLLLLFAMKWMMPMYDGRSFAHRR
uniref:Ig-like domain-containing protein n=1 Tax=Anopheles coluzzii TaxID=1518534 RepID=A0A6E8VXN5_ANOCL